MSTRARSSYHRVPQADARATPSASSEASLAQHIGSLDADEVDVMDADVSDVYEDREDEQEDSDDSDMLKGKRRARARDAAAWSTKMHALLWILAAGGVAYAIDFFHVIFNDPRIQQGYFHVGLVCCGINTCITIYLAIYLPYIKRIHLEWSVYCPRMIPTATAVGVLTTICFLCAFWPVWGLFTPGLLLLFFLGSLMTAHFVPSI